jgi:hypothetical protein
LTLDDVLAGHRPDQHTTNAIPALGAIGGSVAIDASSVPVIGSPHIARDAREPDRHSI